MWEFCDRTATSHAKTHFVTERQHTYCSHHCKDFEGKEWNVFLLLLRTKKGFSVLVKGLCMWEFCDLTATSHAKMHFATEMQHTDCSHHCKHFEGKEWNLFLRLPRIKRAFLRYLQKRQRMQKKLQRRKAVKVVSEACPHSSKADARERKKNTSVKLQKLCMDKKTKKSSN